MKENTLVSPYVYPGLASKHRQLSLDSILTVCCRVCEVSRDSVVSRSRVKSLADCRKLYCYLAGCHTSHTLYTIGKLIGVDHATVIYHKKTAEGFVRFNDDDFLRLHGIACQQLGISR